MCQKKSKLTESEEGHFYLEVEVIIEYPVALLASVLVQCYISVNFLLAKRAISEFVT